MQIVFFQKPFSKPFTGRNVLIIRRTLKCCLRYIIFIKITCKCVVYNHRFIEILHRDKRSTVQPVLAVTSIKQPTFLKQPNKIFPNVKFVLIFTSVKQPPALSSHFLCFPLVLLNTGLTVYCVESSYGARIRFPAQTIKRFCTFHEYCFVPTKKFSFPSKNPIQLLQ